MPRVVNKLTKQVYLIEDAELPAFKARPELVRAFRIIETVVPDEVKKLMEKKGAATK